jgi:hypothetical protein
VDENTLGLICALVGETSNSKSGSATPNINGPGSFRNNHHLINKSSQNVLSRANADTSRDLIPNNVEKSKKNVRRSSVKINIKCSKKKFENEDIMDTFGGTNGFKGMFSDGYLSPISQKTTQFFKPEKKVVRLKTHLKLDQNRYHVTSPESSIFKSFQDSGITVANLNGKINKSAILSNKTPELDKSMLYSVKNHQLYNRSKKSQTSK